MVTDSPESYQKLRTIDLPSEALMKKIILGLSQHDYQEVVKMGVESFGLSQSTVSKAFIEESTKALEEFEKKDLWIYDFIALVIDGKYLSKENTVSNSTWNNDQRRKDTLGLYPDNNRKQQCGQRIVKRFNKKKFQVHAKDTYTIGWFKGFKKSSGWDFREICFSTTLLQIEEEWEK